MCLIIFAFAFAYSLYHFIRTRNPVISYVMGMMTVITLSLLAISCLCLFTS